MNIKRIKWVDVGFALSHSPKLEPPVVMLTARTQVVGGHSCHSPAGETRRKGNLTHSHGWSQPQTVGFPILGLSHCRKTPNAVI